MVGLDISSFQGSWDLGVKGQDDVLLRFHLKLYRVTCTILPQRVTGKNS